MEGLLLLRNTNERYCRIRKDVNNAQNLQHVKSLVCLSVCFTFALLKVVQFCVASAIGTVKRFWVKIARYA